MRITYVEGSRQSFLPLESVHQLILNMCILGLSRKIQDVRLCLVVSTQLTMGNGVNRYMSNLPRSFSPQSLYAIEMPRKTLLGKKSMSINMSDEPLFTLLSYPRLLKLHVTSSTLAPGLLQGSPMAELLYTLHLSMTKLPLSAGFWRRVLRMLKSRKLQMRWMKMKVKVRKRQEGC